MSHRAMAERTLNPQDETVCAPVATGDASADGAVCRNTAVKQRIQTECTVYVIFIRLRDALVYRVEFK